MFSYLSHLGLVKEKDWLVRQFHAVSWGLNFRGNVGGLYVKLAQRGMPPSCHRIALSKASARKSQHQNPNSIYPRPALSLSILMWPGPFHHYIIRGVWTGLLSSVSSLNSFPRQLVLASRAEAGWLALGWLTAFQDPQGGSRWQAESTGPTANH